MELPGSMPEASEHLLRDRLQQLEAKVEDLILELQVQQQTVNDRFERLEGGSAKGRSAANGECLEAKTAVEPESITVTNPTQLCEDVELEYGLEASVWDYSVFIGLPALGLGPSVFMSLLLSVNMLGQSIFILTLILAKNSFVNNTLPKSEDMERWRTTEGHSLANVFAGVSLTQRVCTGDSALSVATAQSGLVSNVQAYMDDSQIGVAWGALLTMFVTLLWFLTIAKELNLIWDQISAFMQLPRERVTRLTKEGSSIKLEAISIGRLVFVCMVATFRLVLTVILLFAGGKWLSSTMSLENLVLNAAALGFVMDLDNFLMEAFSSERCQALAQQLQPLSRPLHGKSFGLGLRPLLLTAGAVLFIAFSLSVDVIPTLVKLQDLSDTICGGNKAFAFSIDPTLNVLQAAATADIPAGGMSGMATIDAKVSRNHRKDLKSHIDGKEEVRIFLKDSLVQLKQEAAWSPSLATSVLACEDNEAYLAMFLPNIQAIANSSASNCSGLLDRCYIQELGIVRCLCMQTCGCDSVLHGPLFRSGCAPACEATPRWRSELLSIDCVDMSALEITTDPLLPYLLDSYLEDFPGGLQDFACDRVQPQHCLPPQATTKGTFLYLCPQSCGCQNASGVFGCPLTCG